MPFFFFSTTFSRFGASTLAQTAFGSKPLSLRKNFSGVARSLSCFDLTYGAPRGVTTRRRATATTREARVRVELDVGSVDEERLLADEALVRRLVGLDLFLRRSALLGGLARRRRRLGVPFLGFDGLVAARLKQNGASDAARNSARDVPSRTSAAARPRRRLAELGPGRA